MAEYIERDAANETLRECVRAYPSSFYNGIEVARSAIIKLPAADVRPVVLCRDCKNSVKGKESLECEKHRYVWNNLNRWVNDDDFCSWGVKREES